jgi:hypothetical protein
LGKLDLDRSAIVVSVERVSSVVVDELAQIGIACRDEGIFLVVGRVRQGVPRLRDGIRDDPDDLVGVGHSQRGVILVLDQQAGE